MKRIFPISFLLLAIVIAAPVSGAMIKTGEVISLSDSVDDDLYIAGGQVNIAEDVEGDLITAGGEITISGDVDEDLTIVGGKLNISGTIGDDARIAGGEVRINGIIKDDLFVAGGRVELGEDAEVFGDVRIAGGEIFIDGEIAGDLDIRAGRVVLRGAIEGNIDLEADDITIFAEIGGTSRLQSSKIALGDSAEFFGDVEYWQEAGEIDFTPYLHGAGASFNPKLAPRDLDIKNVAPALLAAGFIISLISSVLFAAFFIIIAAYLTKNMFTDAARKLRASVGGSILTGFLYFVVAPIVILLLMLSVVGIPVSIFTGFFYGFTIYFAKPITAMVIARCIEQRRKGKKKAWGTWTFIGTSVLIFIVLKAVGLVPIIGWIVLFVTVCSAYGALLSTKWEKLKKMR